MNHHGGGGVGATNGAASGATAERQAAAHQQHNPSSQQQPTAAANGNGNQTAAAPTERSAAATGAPTTPKAVHTGATSAVTPSTPSTGAPVSGAVLALESIYDIKELLGKGHFAKVRKVVHRTNGKDYAVKIIDKKDLLKTTAVVKAEIEILKRVGAHPNIVSLVDHFEGEDEYYLVMELCKGGDLFTKIVSEGKYSEKRAVRCCKQLASALQWIHKQGITHRDLKPENILLTSDSIDADIKVADFGLSKLMKGHQHFMRTVCGTWAYCAPEVISRKPYTQAVDAWTLGVLMFILLSGYHPFDVYGEMPEPQLLKKIKDCDYDFEDDVWTNVGNNAKDLIRGLLQLDPEKRMTIDQYLASPWIMGEGVKDKQLKLVVDRLSKFNDARKKFRALVLAKLVAGKFRASISHSRSPSHLHKIWTGGPRGSPQGDHSPSSPGSPPSMAPLSDVQATTESKAMTSLALEPPRDTKEPAKEPSISRTQPTATLEVPDKGKALITRPSSKDTAATPSAPPSVVLPGTPV